MTRGNMPAWDGGVDRANVRYFKGSNPTATTITAGLNVQYATRDDPDGAWDLTNARYLVLNPGIYRVTVAHKNNGTGVSTSVMIYQNSVVRASSPATPAQAFGGLPGFSWTGRFALNDFISVQYSAGFTTVADAGNPDNTFVIIEGIR